MKLIPLLFMSALLLACRERSVSLKDAAVARATPPATPDAQTVVVGNDRGGKPEELVPEPEEEPKTAEADAGPREQVKLILKVGPVDAEVMYGARRLGLAKRGEPFEIVRPRHSGPVDLLLRAPGFLPYHTRLFSDREDTVSVDLVRPQDAPSLNGWKPQDRPASRAR